MESKIEFGFKNTQDSPGYLLWQVTMLWQRRIKKELDKLGITHTQFVLMSVLAWLSKNNNTVTQVDIAQHSQTDRMMVSKVLRTLESKGLVSRIGHPKDTRANVVILTEKGLDILQEAIVVVESVDNHFFFLDEGEKSVATIFLSLIEHNNLPSSEK